MKKFTIFKIASVIAVTMIFAVACTKSDNQNAVIITDAIIYDTGAIASDGCGWTLKAAANDSTYSPINLGNQYKVNNLKVKVRLRPLKTKLTCGLGATQLREVAIDNITKIP